MRWNATRLPSGDQLGLNAWSVARMRCPEPSAFTTAISPVPLPQKTAPTATASSMPSGDQCGGDACSVGSHSRSGPTRRAWEASYAGASRSHLGHVEAARAAGLSAQEGDPSAVGREPREHAVRAWSEEPDSLR